MAERPSDKAPGFYTERQEANAGAGLLPRSEDDGRLELALPPKHHLADPALAARLLGATAADLLAGESPGPSVPRDGTLLGALFESLVTLSVRVYAQATEANVFHLRTRGGRHEIDLIVERDDGRIIAIEVIVTQLTAGGTERHLLITGPRGVGLNGTERAYIEALAELGDGPVSSADVSQSLGRKPSAVTKTRDALLREAIVYAPSRGELAFTVPHCARFVRRRRSQGNSALRSRRPV